MSDDQGEHVKKNGRVQRFIAEEASDIKQAFQLASASYFSENFVNGVKEAALLFKTYIPRFKEKSNAAKAFSLARGTIVALPLPLLLFTVENPTMTDILMNSASTTILASACCIGRLSKNNLKNAFAVPVIGALAAESYATGAYGFGVFSTAIASYYALMASLPDKQETEALRKKMGVYFGTGGVGTILATAQSPWEAVSAISMAFNTLSTVQIAENSHIARASKVVTHVLNTIYGLGYSESSSAELMGILGLSAEAATIAENDIPQADRQGNALSWKQKIKEYVACLRKPAHRENFVFTCS